MDEENSIPLHPMDYFYDTWSNHGVNNLSDIGQHGNVNNICQR